MTQDTLAILGAGYTGSFVFSMASKHFSRVVLTSRDPDRNLSRVPPERRLRFDLSDPASWRDIPPAADVLWCFPAEPLDLVMQCAACLNLATRRVVVLGSTSAYDVPTTHTYPPPWIDETAPINLTKVRVQGEEFLRKHCGAIVLRVAGIYGPRRNPAEWLKSGRVAPSRKYVNVIHVQDLVGACLAALERGVSGEVYNVSDGRPRTWQEIAQASNFRPEATPPASIRSDIGKRIVNRKLTEQLGYSIQHLDLIQELGRLS